MRPIASGVGNMTRVRRFDQQIHGKGLVVKVKHKRLLLLLQNILDANRELENLNEREGVFNVKLQL